MSQNNGESDSDRYSEARSHAARSNASGGSSQFGIHNEKEEVKKKVVIFGLEEPLGDKKSREENDESTVKQMLIAIGAPSAVIKNMARHGEYQAKPVPRRIVVQFETENDQQYVLFKADELQKNSKCSKWNKVTIKPYLAPNQRRAYQQQNPPQNQHQRQTNPRGLNQQAFNPNIPNDMQQTYQNFLRFQAAQNPLQIGQFPNNLGGSVSPLMTQMFLNQNAGNMTPEMIQLFRQMYLNQPQVNPFPPPPQQPNNNRLPFPRRPRHPKTNNPTSPSEVDDESDYQNVLFESQLQRYNGKKKTLNILVLGETGVGKSTWINGIANYMSFDTLDSAMAAPKPICLIPSKFKFYITALKGVDVTLDRSHGKNDENEVLSSDGQSATQEPKTYQFETPKFIINIIDTPGIGDVRGFEQDKENTRKILNAISNYKELHAICFLIKANEPKLTLNFGYCISELLLQLHKNAVDNIYFFFTNSRAAFYSPGDSLNPLKQFLSNLENDQNLKIPLDMNKNIGCTDNEAFRLVCAHSNGVKFPENEVKMYAESWEKSAAATNKFLEFADSRPPHNVDDTITINKARTVIYHLSKPLADVNEMIESNIKIINDRKRDLNNTKDDLWELGKKLTITRIGWEVKPLPYPKTVCTELKCTERETIQNTNQNRTIYKTICHDHCYLTNVDVEKVPEYHLQGCAAMAGQQHCQKCGCHWGTHMHIRFDQIKVSMEIEDTTTKNLINQNEDASVVKQAMINKCERTIDELKEEQQKIIHASLRFGTFLKANAILPYNDAFEKYVEKTINEEEKCIAYGGDRTKLDNLKKLLAEYQQQKAIMQAVPKDTDPSNVEKISPDDIDVLKARLFNLSHIGETLENLFKATEEGINKHNNHIIVKYIPEIPKEFFDARKNRENLGNRNKRNNRGRR
jgi:GTP-binding protein EngB required for normal cell division